MSDPEIHERLEEVKRAIGWGATTGAARRWWEAFEDENRHQLGVVLRLAQELASPTAMLIVAVLESSSMLQKRDDFGCRSCRVPPLHPSRGPATRGATNPLTAGRSINVTQ